MQAVGARKHWMDSPPAVDPPQLREAPMLAAALCFAAGDLIARRWEPPGLLVSALLFLLLLSIVGLLWSRRIAVVPVLALWAVVGCTCAQIELPISRQQQLTGYADGLSRTVRGRVVRVRELAPENSSPDQVNDQPWALGPGAWEPISGEPHRSVDLQVEAVEDVTPDVSTMRPVSGGVRITLMDAAPVLSCGDVIEIPLRLRVPDTYRDPGAWSYSDYLLGQGISTLASAHTQRLRIVGHATRTWSCRSCGRSELGCQTTPEPEHATRQRRRTPAWMRLDREDTAMLSAMLVGDRTQLTTSLRARIRAHRHLSSLRRLWSACRAAGWRSALAVAQDTDAGGRRDRRHVERLVFCFALLTGFGAPVQRALGMTAAYLLARWLGRDTGPLNALGIAAVIILALDPRALFEASFQMTTLVIIAAAGLARPVEARSFQSHARALHNLDTIALDANMHPRVAQMRVRLRLFGQPLRDIDSSAPAPSSALDSSRKLQLSRRHSLRCRGRALHDAADGHLLPPRNAACASYEPGARAGHRSSARRSQYLPSAPH